MTTSTACIFSHSRTRKRKYKYKIYTGSASQKRRSTNSQNGSAKSTDIVHMTLKENRARMGHESSKEQNNLIFSKVPSSDKYGKSWKLLFSFSTCSMSLEAVFTRSYRRVGSGALSWLRGLKSSVVRGMTFSHRSDM